MYLSTGYLTFWFDKAFGIGGVLFLLMTFSGIFLFSLYAFVPYDQMKTKYAQQFLGKDNREDLLIDKDVENSSVLKSSLILKKWINDQS